MPPAAGRPARPVQPLTAAPLGRPFLHLEGAAPQLALGVPSSAVTFETGRSTAGRNRQRRDRLRDTVGHLGTGAVAGTGGVAMRFVLAGGSISSKREVLEQLDAARAEARVALDMVFLNFNESFHLCAVKKLGWYAYASKQFPTATWYGIADDDSFVHLPRLLADVTSLRIPEAAAAAAGPYVYYGLFGWKPSYDRATLEPSPAFAGWSYLDDGAASMRGRFNRCKAAGGATPPGSSVAGASLRSLRGPCSALKPKEVAAVSTMAADPPYPFANGPLFLVSRALGDLLHEHDYPRSWLAELETTPVLQFYRLKRRVPYVLRRAACYPASFDAVLGWWVYRVAQAARIKVTLVNSPFMVQHHPWVTFTHGAFSNRSVILHELKNPHSKGWTHVRANWDGEFVPTPRECGSCREMGWSTVPGSPVSEWTCCGCRLQSARLEHNCRRRGGAAECDASGVKAAMDRAVPVPGCWK